MEEGGGNTRSTAGSNAMEDVVTKKRRKRNKVEMHEYRFQSMT